MVTSRYYKIKKSLAIVGTGALLLLAGISPHLDRDTYIVNVVDKERVVKKSGDNISSKFLVYTKLNNGKVRVFRNEDSLLELKVRSSDIQTQLERGKTYEVKTYGWRFPLLSMYENIISVREIK